MIMYSVCPNKIKPLRKIMSEILIKGKNCRVSMKQSILKNKINVNIPNEREPIENNTNGIK